MTLEIKVVSRSAIFVESHRVTPGRPLSLAHQQHALICLLIDCCASRLSSDCTWLSQRPLVVYFRQHQHLTGAHSKEILFGRLEWDNAGEDKRREGLSEGVAVEGQVLWPVQCECGQHLRLVDCQGGAKSPLAVPPTATTPLEKNSCRQHFLKKTNKTNKQIMERKTSQKRIVWNIQIWGKLKRCINKTNKRTKHDDCKNAFSKQGC